jgi:two-component system, sensor histidine kinase
MLITGDTAPDRLKEAQASGYLLLHKPVPNDRLREAIEELIRRAT